MKEFDNEYDFYFSDIIESVAKDERNWNWLCVISWMSIIIVGAIFWYFLLKAAI